MDSTSLDTNVLEMHASTNAIKLGFERRLWRLQQVNGTDVIDDIALYFDHVIIQITHLLCFSFYTIHSQFACVPYKWRVIVIGSIMICVLLSTFEQTVPSKNWIDLKAYFTNVQAIYTQKSVPCSIIQLWQLIFTLETHN